MKRSISLFVTVLALLATVASGSERTLSFKVRNVLDRAVQNEREAAARYRAFATRADEEGYPGAASLFRAAARAEQIHASRFAAALTERGLPVPAEVEQHPEIGSTQQNLRTASSNESSERDGIYREGVNAARGDSDQELALLFDQTRDTEVEHLNLFVAASQNTNALKSPKPFYVCERCGYTTDVNLPMCALCRLGSHPHEVD